jgi:hypothetical protein
MIQRKQTLWLALISFICFSSIYINIPFYEVDGKLDGKVLENAIASVGFSETILTIEKEKVRTIDNSFLKYVTLALGLCSLIAIFLYKQRQRQFLLIRMSYGLILGMLVFMYYYGWSKRYVDLQPDGQIIISILFPFILAWANYKAFKGIKHDDNLVKSYDRIR